MIQKGTRVRVARRRRRETPARRVASDLRLPMMTWGASNVLLRREVRNVRAWSGSLKRFVSEPRAIAATSWRNCWVEIVSLVAGDVGGTRVTPGDENSSKTA